MPPSLALFVTLAFCSVLLVRDSLQKPKMSGALWIPVIWISLVGSKFVSEWMDLIGSSGARVQGLPEDGSPLDATVFMGLIFCGLIVLIRRQTAFSEFARRNIWLTVFILYCLVAVSWSDFPFVAFKRWIKMLGHPIMALIVLTDQDREDALRTVLRRSAYLLIPLSIVFIKYFPQFGRGFDDWTGQAMNRGISHNKNELGYLCMVFGLFFLWDLMSARSIEDTGARRRALLLSVAFLGQIWWLLAKADSATSLACTIIGSGTMMVLGMRIVSRRFLGSQVLIGLLAVVLAVVVFDAHNSIIDLLGRDSSLTDRTVLWRDVLAYDINPVFGAGFESFWLGPRLAELWSKWWWHPNQAHNGYIETYLNLGWVGIFILAALIISTFRKGCREMLANLSVGRFRLAWLLTIVAYNYTEATFKGVHLVWTMFHFIAIDYSRGDAKGLFSHSDRGLLRPAVLPTDAKSLRPPPTAKVSSSSGFYQAPTGQRATGVNDVPRAQRRR